MSYIGVKISGLREKVAGMPLMDVAFSNSSTNGVQNKVIKAKFDEVEAALPVKALEVVADGVKTRQALLFELFSTISAKSDKAKDAILDMNGNIFHCSNFNATLGEYGFHTAGVSASKLNVTYLSIASTEQNCHYRDGQVSSSGLTIVSLDDNIPSAGTKYVLYI